MAVLTQEITDRYAVYHSDCMEVIPTLPSSSVHLSVYSPPFCGLFHYSSSERDMSNCRSYGEFFEHYEYLVREIHRVTLPGRISAVHCMDVPKDGANICGYRDFPGDIIRLHQEVGFEYLPRICIWKEPLGVRNRTMAKALTHRQVVEDATLTNVAAADYLIPFRRKGANPFPVVHSQGLMSYAGERQVPADLMMYRGWKGNQIENRYSHWIWRQYASCFWDDIRIRRILPYVEADKEKDERHMHPLQLDVIERCVQMWSNPDEVVMTPFLGVGSEVYGAVTNGRKGVGIELKSAYYNQAIRNLASIGKAAVEDQSSFFPALDEDIAIERDARDIFPAESEADPGPSAPARPARKPRAVSRPVEPYRLPGGVPPVVASEVDAPLPGQASFLDPPPAAPGVEPIGKGAAVVNA